MNNLQHTGCKDVYWEYVGLFKDVFVKYYLDKDEKVLHQISLSGEHYCLRKVLPDFWDTYEVFLAESISGQIADQNRQYYSIGFSTDELVSLSRREAESLEDEWVRNSTFCG